MAVLRLQDEAGNNAFSQAFVAELVAALEEVGRSSAVKTVVVCGLPAVFSAGGKISWVRASDSLTVQIPYRPLVPSSLAHAFFERGSLVEMPTYVPAEAWFSTEAQVDILEHSTCHPEYGTVLSMLWIPAAAAPVLSVWS